MDETLDKVIEPEDITEYSSILDEENLQQCLIYAEIIKQVQEKTKQAVLRNQPIPQYN